MRSFNLKCFTHNPASFSLSHSFSFPLPLVKGDSAVYHQHIGTRPYQSLWKLMLILVKCPNIFPSCCLFPLSPDSCFAHLLHLSATDSVWVFFSCPSLLSSSDFILVHWLFFHACYTMR